ncbi:hypothetical protein PDIG_70170 [Penicillium digitatum PHI26]|uniref:Uncharacterized protein n=2 Tax=Penicillium digitatum TaxID=36651 RepID=K9G3Y8_PEND2|nr:hypothetical protein PDIP_79480 [Penicillium digitatum Pd1]EKV06323.1 hypothetical protein PDIP_79480 [Penicillium digitatum Pd1]EKV07941.1 hypothetical protein PDIG_70170 [Penicillium digitatum PHI26]
MMLQYASEVPLIVPFFELNWGRRNVAFSRAVSSIIRSVRSQGNRRGGKNGFRWD